MINFPDCWFLIWFDHWS